MMEKMLLSMLGLDENQAQDFVKNALVSFQNFEKSIETLMTDVAKIKQHLGIDVSIENVIEGDFVKKDDQNAA